MRRPISRRPETGLVRYIEKCPAGDPGKRITGIPRRGNCEVCGILLPKLTDNRPWCVEHSPYAQLVILDLKNNTDSTLEIFNNT